MSDLETRYGLLQVPDGGEDIVGGFLARYGEWAWLEVCFVADTLSDNARVLDVGAFVGTFGLGVALRRRLGKLCLVEANQAVAAYLNANVSRNLDCAFDVLEGMVAGSGAALRTGHVDMGNLGSVSYAGEHAGSVEIPAARQVFTLAELRQLHGPFDLIKLDIEGMEQEALLGDAAYLSQGETSLWIECNEDHRSLEVGDTLLSWGLHLYYFAFPSFNVDNFKGDPAPIFPMAYEAGLLAAPRFAPALSDELREKGCILKTIRSHEDLKDALWRTPRWGRAEWEQAKSRPELAAIVCRSLRDEDFSSFLDPAATQDAKAPQTLWQRLEAADQGLRHTESLLGEERAAVQALTKGLQEAADLAISRLAEIDAERQRRETVEAALREAQTLAFARLDEVTAEREGRLRAEQALSEALKHKIAAEDRLEAAERECAAAAARSLAHLAALGNLRDQEEARNAEWQAQIAAGQRELRVQRKAWEAEVADIEQEGEARIAAVHAEHEIAREAWEAEIRAWEAQLATVREEHQAEREKWLDRISEFHKELQAASERAALLEMRVAEAQARALHAERLTDDIRYSTVWRLSAPLRAVVEAVPIVHLGLKRCRALARVVIHGR